MAYAPSPDLQEKTLRCRLLERLHRLGRCLTFTIAAVNPFTVTISMVFHFCLLFVPLFLLGHTAMAGQALGLVLPSIPDGLADGMTLVVLFACLFFLVRRVALSRVRAITSVYDYLVLALATVPFLSGFLAYHQLLALDYRTLMIVHMLSGEVMIMAIPFTKLTHMIFFFLNRFTVVGEHSLGRGSRVW